MIALVTSPIKNPLAIAGEALFRSSSCDGAFGVGFGVGVLIGKLVEEGSLMRELLQNPGLSTPHASQIP